uniref:Omega-scoloptoxin n=1 Tax=Hemiscolopendra marginata TaxID=943146 RepID=A0A646QE61_9MYRI
MSNRVILLLLVLTMILSFFSIEALKCYKCESTNTAAKFDCHSTLPKELTDCPAEMNKYCFLERVEKSNGELHRTFRGCQKIGKGPKTECSDENQYKHCIYFCDSNGCNSGISVKPMMRSFLLGVALLPIFFALSRNYILI